MDKRVRQAQIRLRNHEFAYSYLEKNPCISCGETDPIVLEFDHRDPSEKVANVCTGIMNRWSLKKLQKEISKCDILCANCHRIKSAREGNYYSYRRQYLK